MILFSLSNVMFITAYFISFRKQLLTNLLNKNILVIFYIVYFSCATFYRAVYKTILWLKKSLKNLLKLFRNKKFLNYFFLPCNVYNRMFYLFKIKTFQKICVMKILFNLIDKVYIDGSCNSKTVYGVLLTCLKRVSHVTHFYKDTIPMRDPLLVRLGPKLSLYHCL